MDPNVSIWSKEYTGPPPQARPPQPPAEETQFEQALPPEMRLQRRPGKVKMALLIGTQIALGLLKMAGRLLLKIVGYGLIAVGTTLSYLKRKTSSQNPDGSKKKMGLKAVFLGACLACGAMMAPGGYYMTQPNEIVRTRVTGKVEADAKAEFPGQKYVIYTNQGKFDTYGVEGGKDIKEGVVYDFNVKSARLDIWPPGYTRSIVSFKPVSGGPGSGP